MVEDSTPSVKRTDGPQQSPLDVSIVWNKDGTLKPPLTEKHQNLIARWRAANKKSMETRSKEDFNAYMKLNRELSQVISEATERLKKGILETVKHGALADRVEQAHNRWQETRESADLDRWLTLNEELEYAVMDEIYDASPE